MPSPCLVPERLADLHVRLRGRRVQGNPQCLPPPSRASSARAAANGPAAPQLALSREKAPASQVSQPGPRSPSLKTPHDPSREGEGLGTSALVAIRRAAVTLPPPGSPEPRPGPRAPHLGCRCLPFCHPGAHPSCGPRLRGSSSSPERLWAWWDPLFRLRPPPPRCSPLVAVEAPESPGSRSPPSRLVCPLPAPPAALPRPFPSLRVTRSLRARRHLCLKSRVRPRRGKSFIRWNRKGTRKLGSEHAPCNITVSTSSLPVRPVPAAGAA